MKPFPNLEAERIPEPDEPKKNDIVDSTGFDVGIVGLERNQEIAPHPEPYAVFFYILEGAGEFTGGDGTVDLEAGDGLYLEPGERRGIRCTEPLSILGIRGAD